MVYGLFLFNTVLIILFIATCIVLFIGIVHRLSSLQKLTNITMKKYKRIYQHFIDDIGQLRTLQTETAGCSDQTQRQKYLKVRQNLYNFFAIHQQNQMRQLFKADFKSSDGIYMMDFTKTELKNPNK
uniref:Uncharacterized protein n=1 Tax=Setaria digitata TaxID=48799 RepID=A0A915Q6Z8_9BILA